MGGVVLCWVGRVWGGVWLGLSQFVYSLTVTIRNLGLSLQVVWYCIGEILIAVFWLTDGIAQVGIAQVGIAQVGKVQVGTAQVGIDQDGTAQVSIDQVGIESGRHRSTPERLGE